MYTGMWGRKNTGTQGLKNRRSNGQKGAADGENGPLANFRRRFQLWRDKPSEARAGIQD